MTKPLSIYYPDGAYSYANWMGLRPAHDIESADVLGLSGGSDIASFRYGKREHPTTYSNPSRDDVEFAAIEVARKRGIPIVGTCRGSQALCVAAGGLLIQDVAHPYTHEATTYDGQTISLNSMHHQMQSPWNLPSDQFKVLAWAEGISPYYFGETDIDIMKPPGAREPEVVFYPGLRAVGYQHHPEAQWYRYESDDHVRHSIDWCRTILDRLITNTL